MMNNVIVKNMKTAVIVHGMISKEEYAQNPISSQDHWYPWLKKELSLHNISCEIPQFPEPYDPVYEKWCAVFEQYKIDQNTVLIGHSLGAGFLVRWLSENKVLVGKVMLVAPFLDPDHDEVRSDFFNFAIDNRMWEKTQGLHLFISSDDDQEILTSANQIRIAVKEITVKEFSNRGHFTFDDMKTDEFPELLNMILN